MSANSTTGTYCFCVRSSGAACVLRGLECFRRFRFRQKPAHGRRKGRFTDDFPRIAIAADDLQLCKGRLERIIGTRAVHLPCWHKPADVLPLRSTRDRRQNAACCKPDISGRKVLCQLPAVYQKSRPVQHLHVHPRVLRRLSHFSDFITSCFILSMSGAVFLYGGVIAFRGATCYDRVSDA